MLVQLDTTKTGDSEAIPMTLRLACTLAKLKQRGYATSDEDFVFAYELDLERPLPENVIPLCTVSGDATATFLERLEDEMPAKWLREVQRLYAETSQGAVEGA